MFVDHIRIFAKAGDGGCGCVSFRREKFIPKGGPDGGDGGRGGNIILRVDVNVDNLAALFYEPILKARNGGNGLGKQCYGRAAQSKVFHVPAGTLVYRAPASVKSPQDSVSELELVEDMDREGKELVLCRGGDGGKGNIHFKSSRNRVPRQYTEGVPGEEGYFYLELRKIADAGLIGFPNAGKSTLLGRLSSAHPKVAAYPFTTLHPIVGVVEFPGYKRATVADIPGLIEGAHKDIGLGHDFLRHVVRCKLLIFVLDMAGSEGRSPIADLATLRKELKLYDPQLAKRPWMVAANKMDLPGAAENLKQFKARHRKISIIPIAAAENTGIDVLKEKLNELIPDPQRT